MRRIGFDNEKYLYLQSQKIRERIAQFGGKLYLEFGGKLFDDYHASRVLPGFQPDSKIRMLMQLRDQAEIVIAGTGEAIYIFIHNFNYTKYFYYILTFLLIFDSFFCNMRE